MPRIMNEIDAMSNEEKLATMDMLWTSILSGSQSVEPPAWHEAVLNERRRRVAAGEEVFIPWDEAKRSLCAEFA